nr:MAG TPA: hypothetical protein [Caudoviricetes sp.]
MNAILAIVMRIIKNLRPKTNYQHSFNSGLQACNHK